MWVHARYSILSNALFSWRGFHLSGFWTFSTRILCVSVSFGGSRSTTDGAQTSESMTLFNFQNAVLTSFLSVFDYTYLLFWNSFWTIAPVIGIGLFDRVVGKSLTMSSPLSNNLTRCRFKRAHGVPWTLSLWTWRAIFWNQVVRCLYVGWNIPGGFFCSTRCYLTLTPSTSLLLSSSSSSIHINLPVPVPMDTKSGSTSSPQYVILPIYLEIYSTALYRLWLFRLSWRLIFSMDWIPTSGLVGFSSLFLSELSLYGYTPSVILHVSLPSTRLIS